MPLVAEISENEGVQFVGRHWELGVSPMLAPALYYYRGNVLSINAYIRIWTGSLQEDSHFSATDNACQENVDCNYHGDCVERECVCHTDEGVSFVC